MIDDYISCCENCKFSALNDDIWECRLNPPQILIEEDDDNPEICDFCSVFPMVTPYLWCGQYQRDMHIEVFSDNNVAPDIVSVKSVNNVPTVEIDMTKETNTGCGLV